MASMSQQQDLYMILEVEQTATPKEIADSYKRLALKLHPDRTLDYNTTAAFQEVCQFPVRSICFSQSFTSNVLNTVLTFKQNVAPKCV
jgi:hypothetical protein